MSERPDAVCVNLRANFVCRSAEMVGQNSIDELFKWNGLKNSFRSRDRYSKVVRTVFGIRSRVGN